MLEKLFEQIDSELLTDEVKLQLSTLFESQLNEAIEAEKVKLEEKNEKEITEFKDQLIEQIDEYLSYITEEIVDEKEEDIEEATKVATAEKILESFKELAGAFFVSTTPEAVHDSTALDEAKEELNEAVNRAVDAEKELQKLRKTIAIQAKAAELETDSEKEKFTKLAESLDYVDEDSFAEKLQVVADTVKSPEAPAEEQIEEEEETPGEVIEESKEQEKSDPMDKYMKHFKKA